MNQQTRLRSLSHIALVLIVLAGGLTSLASTIVTAQDTGGVATITGTMSLELASDVQLYVGLIDLTGLVQRDYSYAQEQSLITGRIDHGSGAFRIDLPISPMAPLNNVGHGTEPGAGVQIFSIDQMWNFIGDLQLSPLELQGWSWKNTSLKTAHGTHEIVGGRIAVWSPDDVQQFPADFGPDGKLFTSDDPVAPIGSGWSVVDLDARPFTHNRSTQADVTIGLNENEPVDLSGLTPTAAFDQMVETLRVRYPFAKERPVDWDALRTTYRPEFEAAEQSGLQVDFWLALNNFLIATNTWSYFSNYPWDEYYSQQLLGSMGLHIGITDDNRVIVTKVDAELPAESAGIQAGAELITWNGRPARQAVDEVLQRYSQSSPRALLLDKTRHFGRLPLGTSVQADYRNPNTTEIVSATLTPVEIPGEDIWDSVFCYRAWFDCELKPRVWFEELPSRIGVIHLSFYNANSQAHRLILDSWERMMFYYSVFEFSALIIDLRQTNEVLDTPTSALAMAGSFFPEPFPLAEMTSIDADGNEVPVGTATVLPAPLQWDRPVALLVDDLCFETCELFAYAMSKRPNVIIAGMSATGGSLSGTSEPILLPTDNFVQVVDLAYRDPVTHELLIQGKGIEPNLRIPSNAETLVANVTTDIVMEAAEQALLAQIAGTDSDGEATPQT